MPTARPLLLEPRKSPVQARSTTSVPAILDATLQVLVAIGKERLTTTRVAHRAGVSVGTLYQYFPNKSAMLQAALRRHLESVVTVLEHACEANVNAPLEQRVAHVIDAFLDAKLKDLKTSRALYSVSSDVDGIKIAQQTAHRSHRALATLLASAHPPLSRDPQAMAFPIHAAMVGVARSLLERPSPDKHIESTRRELQAMIAAYLASCTPQGGLSS